MNCKDERCLKMYNLLLSETNGNKEFDYQIFHCDSDMCHEIDLGKFFIKCNQCDNLYCQSCYSDYCESSEESDEWLCNDCNNQMYI